MRHNYEQQSSQKGQYRLGNHFEIVPLLYCLSDPQRASIHLRCDHVLLPYLSDLEKLDNQRVLRWKMGNDFRQPLLKEKLPEKYLEDVFQRF